MAISMINILKTSYMSKVIHLLQVEVSCLAQVMDLMLPVCKIAEVPCLKTMKDGGVIPKEQLKTKKITDQKTTTVTLESPTDQKKTPIFESVKVSPGDVKEVKITPTDKNGKPTDETQTAKVPDSTKPTDVKFKKPLEADKLVVTLVSNSDKPSNADVISVVACMEVPTGMILSVIRWTLLS